MATSSNPYTSVESIPKEVEAWTDEMGFVAGRFEDVSAVADRFGRVYADPFTSVSSIGNLVDTADPDATAENGPIEGVYNHGGCFKTDDSGRIGYYPLEKIAVGFEYELKYRSDFRIANRDELMCFDRVYLDDDVERKFSVKTNMKIEGIRSTTCGATCWSSSIISKGLLICFRMNEKMEQWCKNPISRQEVSRSGWKRELR